MIAIVVLVVFSLGFYGGQAFVDSNDDYVVSDEQREVKDLDLDQFWDVWSKVQIKYVDAEHIDHDNAVYGAIKGMVSSLDDPYSAFLTPDETQVFQDSLNSELEGIGAELTIEEGLLVVVSPLKDSPAEKASLKPGDVIIAIDATDAQEYSFFEAIQNIRGPRGTKVILTVVREGLDEPIDVTITRDRIDLESVTTEVLEDDIFYISINQFSDDTEKEFFEAVNEALLIDPSGVVLDLRFNGGGYLETSVNIMGEFVEDGLPGVIIESTASRNREVLEIDGNQRLIDVPLVVLINEGSASSSEILAGALQDYERAFIIGSTSFGKGSVQEIETLNDGSSLRLTIAKWLTPSERDIDAEGIAPDLTVEITEEDAENDVDPQLDKAVEYLLNLESETEAVSQL